MTKSKSLKRALIMSVISILVCSAMLVGATFAWFSDTVKTGVNTIIAGNLKVGIEYDASGDDATEADWQDAVDADIFPDIERWEPGMMVISDSFRVVNKGEMALQYTITALMADKVFATDEEDVKHGLSEVIKYKVIAAADLGEIADTAAARAELWASIDGADMAGTLGVAEDDSTSDALVVVLYWAPTTNDNLYNVAIDADQLKTEFSISVYATQVASESDGIGDKYDDVTVLTMEGEIDDDTYVSGNIILGSDLNFINMMSLRFNGGGILDLNSHSIESSAFTLMVDDGSVTIIGNGAIKAGDLESKCVQIRDGAKLTINEGTYYGAVYVDHTNNASTLVINGGTFHGWINVGDNSGKGVVVINGGDFSDCWFNENDIYEKDGKTLKDFFVIPAGWHFEKVEDPNGASDFAWDKEGKLCNYGYKLVQD